MAWVSGAEKSRQWRHDWADGCAWDVASGLGLVLWILDRSGREDRGTGGGAPWFRAFPLVTLEMPWSLFIPYESADLLAGIGGGCSSLSVCPADSFPAGLRGGSAGVVGGDRLSGAVTLGDDFELRYGTLDFSISSYLFSISALVRLGGRGGSVEGSKTGGNGLSASMEGVLDDFVFDVLFDCADIDGALEVEVLAVPFDNAEIDDMFDVKDAIDSVESRLINCCSGGFLGGKAGEASVERLRGGSLGGGGGFGLYGSA